MRALLLCGLIAALVPVRILAQASPQGGPHDFDFEFGAWKAHLSRLTHPLTGSKTWVAYDGTSVVRKIWDGRGNLGELDVTGPSGRVEGLSLRLYNPQLHRWLVSWASSSDGELTKPMSGGFSGGTGLFYNDDTLDGRSIKVRFVFSALTPESFHFEQAFSADGGRTWEVNWKASFTRATPAAHR